MRAFGPQRTVHVAVPTIRWEVWPGPGSSLTSASMSINGQEVRPHYDNAARALEYTPSRPLEPGDYKVDCKVVVDDCLPVNKDWSFSVANGALKSVPQPSDEQIREVDEINSLRETIGLPDFQIDPRLCAAAMAHTSYLSRNGLTGHYERPGDPLFLGTTPVDRLEAFGFTDGSWEGVDFGPQNPEQSLQRLFDAPYHRLPFLQPGSPSVGVGFVPSHMTMDFGMSAATSVDVSPCEGQQGVRLSWEGPESPDPLAVHAMNGVVGYPIVFAYFSPKEEGIVVEKASLETALGQKVPFVLNTPDNDQELKFAAFVIPKQKLQPNTGYTVTVQAHTDSGEDISKTWRFVTGWN